jgi:hypothetical protein
MSYVRILLHISNGKNERLHASEEKWQNRTSPSATRRHQISISTAVIASISQQQTVFYYKTTHHSTTPFYDK